MEERERQKKEEKAQQRALEETRFAEERDKLEMVLGEQRELLEEWKEEERAKIQVGGKLVQ